MSPPSPAFFGFGSRVPKAVPEAKHQIHPSAWKVGVPETSSRGLLKSRHGPPPYPLQFGPDNKRYEYYAALRALPAGAAPGGGGLYPELLRPEGLPQPLPRGPDEGRVVDDPSDLLPGAVAAHAVLLEHLRRGAPPLSMRSTMYSRTLRCLWEREEPPLGRRCAAKDLELAAREEEEDGSLAFPEEQGGRLTRVVTEVDGPRFEEEWLGAVASVG